MIDIKKISYSAENRDPILKDITLHISKSDFACILGRSGAGKSTLLKIICSLLKPQTGAVEIDGSSLPSYKPRELAKIIGYVPQYIPTNNHFTVEEYVFTGRFAYTSFLGSLTKTDTNIAEESLALTELLPFKKRLLSSLSGGQLRRVMIAAALAQTPKVLLLDEPTIYLDPYWSTSTMILLESIHKKGTTIVMVSHDINQAVLFCSSFIGIRGGEILFQEGDINKLLETKSFDELFGMKFESVMHKSDKSIQLISGILK